MNQIKEHLLFEIVAGNSTMIKPAILPSIKRNICASRIMNGVVK